MQITKKQTPPIEKQTCLKNKNFFAIRDLNFDQKDAFHLIKNQINKEGIIIIDGLPGTGKSTLACFMFRNLIKDFKTVLTSSAKQTVDVFKNDFAKSRVKINESKILNSAELAKNEEKFDIAIVDSAQHLLRKSGKGYIKKFEHVSRTVNELDLIVPKCRLLILFYDENQSVHDGDLFFEEAISKYKVIERTQIKNQERCMQGQSYVEFIIQFLNNETHLPFYDQKNYDLKSFESFSKLYKKLKDKSIRFPLTRLVSGSTRTSNAKTDNKNPDFDLDGIQLFWNKNTTNWRLDKDKLARNLIEIGHYHAVQDLNLDYVGVIVGRDLYLGKNNMVCVDEKFVVAPNDRPVKKSEDLWTYHNKLQKWVVNRYKLLLTRGIYGTYIYFEDERLREFFKTLIYNPEQ